ncbi:hypothetical protein [Pedobacter sp. ASV12]|uniref:hypothetical protein n=1 Tax=Pedobacter sp. ASV12 TaxID=2795120 RepID=UPI0018EE0FF0|nr:hypothetical protein [Pedobacter sp. ASV12]
MIIYNIEGNSLIKIRYDGTTISLYFENRLGCIVVAGPHQEVENDYYINCNSNINLALGKLDEVINSKKIKFYENSSTSIADVLASFESGEYYVTHINSSDFIKYQLQSNGECELICGTPLKQETIVVCTKSANDLDRKKVNALKEAILNGATPNVYLYSKQYRGQELYGYYFIVEGNHLLQAYEELNMEPLLLAFVNHQPLKDDYDEIDPNVINIITSFEDIKNTSYKYFYKSLWLNRE